MYFSGVRLHYYLCAQGDAVGRHRPHGPISRLDLESGRVQESVGDRVVSARAPYALRAHHRHGHRRQRHRRHVPAIRTRPPHERLHGPERTAGRRSSMFLCLSISLLN